MKPAWLETFRHWLDDTEASFVANPQPELLSQAAHLFVPIAREIKAAIPHDAFTPYSAATVSGSASTN